MKTQIHACFAALAAFFAVGCHETIDSKNLRTAGIAALIEAEATDSSSATVHATLKTGGAESNTYVLLQSGDRIYAQVGTTRTEMEAVGDGEYEIELAKLETGAEITVILDREVDEDAPNSFGTLPDPFSIDSLGSGERSRAEPLEIRWSPVADDSMEIEVDGSCIYAKTFDVPGDPGSFTIEAGELEATNASKPETCDVTVDVRRSRDGKADAAFDAESYFKLRQARSTSFTSAP